MCGDITDKNDKEPWLNTEAKLLVLPQIFQQNQQNPFWTERKKKSSKCSKPTCRLSLLHRLFVFLITTDEIVKAGLSLWRRGQLTRPWLILCIKVHTQFSIGWGAGAGFGGAIQLIDNHLFILLGGFIRSTGLLCSGWGLAGHWWKLFPIGGQSIRSCASTGSKLGQQEVSHYKLYSVFFLLVFPFWTWV